MNYYNPYFSMYPYVRPSLFSRITGSLGRIKFGSILNGTQKTLNIINQTIPIVKQAKPVINNAKTMFKVMNEFKKSEKPKQNNYTSNTTINNQSKNNNTPTFFM